LCGGCQLLLGFEDHELFRTRVAVPSAASCASPENDAGRLTPGARMGIRALMALEVGIVGLPNVGKSTLFNALTAVGAAAENYPFCTIEPNIGAVAVPDPNLDTLASLIKSEKIIPAMVRIVDIAGIVKGASTGEGLGNKFLSHIRDVDAILHVVRCFEDGDVVHVDGSVHPLRDISTIETELLLADLDSVSGSYERTKKQATHQKDLVPTVDVLAKCLDALKTGKPVRALEISDPEELKILKGFGLITAKKVLYVANVSEADPHGKGELATRVREHAAKEGSGMVPVCSKLEAELSELGTDDRKEMLESLGMSEPALASLAREAYRLLGMTVYYTAGPKEIRAWQIPVGCLAPKAASVIHTDFEKGFIRAEIYNVQDLVKLKTEAAIRSAGKLRVEGKTYIFQEGDVAHFLFNV